MERLDKLQNLNNTQTKANELLLARAIRTNCICDSLVTKISFKKGDQVLIRNKSRKKFESKQFRLYKVLESYLLSIYTLEEPNSRVLRSLINRLRLLEAKVDNPKSLQISQATQSTLYRARLRLKRPKELRKVLEIDNTLLSYLDLSIFTREEQDKFRRNSIRHK